MKRNEELKIVEVLSPRNSKPQGGVEVNFKTDKENVITEFLEIMNTVVSPEQLQIVKKAIVKIPPILEAVKSALASMLVEKGNKIPNNKK